MVAGYRQSGAALILGLLMLLVLSLLAMSSMDRVTMQEKMVSAQREGNQALEMTEDAILEAEERLYNGLISLEDFSDSGPYYDAGTAPDVHKKTTWQDNNSEPATDTEADWEREYERDIEPPRYFIERIGDVAGTEAVTDGEVNTRQSMTGVGARPKGFRVVAMARGLSGEARRVVEIYYAAELR